MFGRLPNDSSSRLQSDLMTLARFVLDKLLEYAPFSSNKNIMEGTSEEQPIHRLLWINAMRATNDKYGIRQIVKGWNIDLTPEVASEKHENCPVRIKGRSMSLFQLNDYIYEKIEHIDAKEFHKDGAPITEKERAESVAMRVIEWGIGNCSDLSRAAFVMLMHYPSSGLGDMPAIDRRVRVEVLSIENDDHEFLVINRKEDSDINVPASWGRAVLILDPWLKECYPLSDALSGTTLSPSMEHIFEDDLFENEKVESKCDELTLDLAQENSGYVSEGCSDFWKKKGNLDIFKLEKRPLYPRENIPWDLENQPANKNIQQNRP